MLSDAKYSSIYDKRNQILTPKQIRQRLPIAIAQVKTSNTPENLLNEIRQIKYFLYQAKEIIKKVFNNTMNSIKVWFKVDTIFINSGNSKTVHSHRVLLNLLDKINLKRSDKYVDLSNVSMYCTWKNK